MGSDRDQNLGLLPALIAGLAGVAVAWVVFRTIGTGDYRTQAAVDGDNAGPAIDALIHGRLALMAHLQPLMGLTSLLVRAPFAAAAKLAGGGDHLVYRAGSVACLLPAAGLVAWLIDRCRTRGELVRAALAGIAILAGPATLQAIQIGHPEDVLAATLATAAVLAASRARPVGAAVLLGLAIGSKQWALVAAPCVLLALPGRRTVMVTCAAAVTLLLVVPLPLASPSGFAAASRSVGGIRYADPFGAWWLTDWTRFGPGGSAHLLPLGLSRSVLSALALLVAAIAIAAYARRVGVRRASQVHPLALLALLGLVRCVGDPDPLTYNFVAALIPLAVWEIVDRRRLPVLTGLLCAALYALPSAMVAVLAGQRTGLGLPLVAALTVGGTMALAACLARGTFAGAPAQEAVGGHVTARVSAPSAR